MAVGPKPKPVAERFESAIERVTESGCWLWTGTTIRGYGVLYTGSRSDKTRRMVYAHRLAWELTRQPIRDGLFVLHRCDVPACCNPDHLYLGTHDDNMADRTARGRVPKGEKHNQARLTAAQVREIRASNKTQAALAARYGVSESAICHAVSRRTWRNV